MIGISLWVLGLYFITHMYVIKYIYIYICYVGDWAIKKKKQKNTSLAREKGRVENDRFFFFLECVIYISNKISSKISDLS